MPLARHNKKAFLLYPSIENRQIFQRLDKQSKNAMLVAYPLPGKGYRYTIRRGSGLFITFKAFGDASIEIISRIVPRFFHIHTQKGCLREIGTISQTPPRLYYARAIQNLLCCLIGWNLIDRIRSQKDNNPHNAGKCHNHD